MVQDEVWNFEEEGRRAKSIKLATQGAWTRWNLPERTIMWSELWQLEPVHTFCSEQCTTSYWPQSNCTGGESGWTLCAGCVEVKEPWHTSCLGVKQHWPKGDIGGTMTRCWQCLQTFWSKRGERNIQPKHDHCREGVMGLNTLRSLGTTWWPLLEAKVSSITNGCMKTLLMLNNWNI